MYKKVLLKLSGEALAGDKKQGIDNDVLKDICISIKKVYDLGVEVAVVVGGGNFWRGKYGRDMVKTTADYMGMLATIMNALAIQDSLEKLGIQARVQTSIEMRQIAEPFIQRRAVRHLEKGRVVIFAGGTGSPFFTTDTAASLRAAEIDAEIILVAKTVDGVYTSDPKEDPNATKYDHLTYQEILEQNLKIMDLTSISLCKDNDIPLIVFGMDEPDNIIKAVKGEHVGTKIDNNKEQ